MNTTERENNSGSTDATDILKNEFGVEVTHESEVPTEDQLKSGGYSKLSEDAFARLSAAMQQIPGVAADQASNKALKGAFRIVIPEGAALMQKGNGAYTTAYRIPTSSRIAGQGDAIPIDLAAEGVASVALSVFTAASVVTGQYFMSRIDNKLGSLQSTVSDIKQFLESDKESEMVANSEILSEVNEDLESILSNPILMQKNLERVISIKDSFHRQIKFFKSAVDTMLGNLSTSDNKKAVNDKRDELRKALINYHYSVQLYQSASLLEIWLTGPQDLEQIDRIVNRMLDHSKGYKTTFDDCIAKVRDYVDDVKGIHPNLLPYLGKSSLGTLLPTLVYFFIPGGSIKAFITAIKNSVELGKEYADEDEKIRKQFFTKFRKDLKHIMPEALDVIPNAVSEMREHQEIIFTEEAAYIKKTQTEVASC